MKIVLLREFDNNYVRSQKKVIQPLMGPLTKLVTSGVPTRKFENTEYSQTNKKIPNTGSAWKKIFRNAD